MLRVRGLAVEPSRNFLGSPGARHLLGTKPSFAPPSLNVGLCRKLPFCGGAPEAAEAVVTLPMQDNGDVSGAALVLSPWPIKAMEKDDDLLIPMSIDHDPCAHCRIPMDMMRHGWLTRLFQAKQQWSTMSS
jgi:hypothetical protein